MTAYTADELFAREYSAETGFAEPSIRQVIASFDRKSGRFDSRAKFSWIPKSENNIIIKAYDDALPEIKKQYKFNKKFGKNIILSDNKLDINSWLSEQMERKEAIHEKLFQIGRDYVKSMDHRPDFAYIQGSASLASKKPFLYVEEGGNTFFFSDLDITMIYPTVNWDIFEHCKKQAYKKSKKNSIQITPWPFSYENTDYKENINEMAYAAHTFTDIDRGIIFFNDDLVEGIRLY